MTRLLWHQMYQELSEPPTGCMGDILSRGEAQVMRLALLLALLDGDNAIRTIHLRAAHAFWKYCEASVAYIFGDSFADPKAARIWEALAAGPMSLTEVNALFNRHATKREIEAALEELAPRLHIESGGPGGMKVIRRR